MKVSVIVRSHNDAAFVGCTLEMLSRQTGDFDLEIVSIDDRSTDGTREILDRFFRIVRAEAPEGNYNPPRTLNAAVKSCSGELIAFVNADAIPENEFFIRELTAPLADPEVGAVYGRQKPRPDALLQVRLDHERAFGDEAPDWEMFSLAASAARRELLDKFPFDPRMQYSEDAEWAQRLKKAGYRIVYAPKAVVEHSHNYTLAELHRRFFNEGYADFQIYGVRSGWRRRAARRFAALKRDLVYWAKHGKPGELFPLLHRRNVQLSSHSAGERAGESEAAGK